MGVLSYKFPNINITLQYNEELELFRQISFSYYTGQDMKLELWTRVNTPAQDEYDMNFSRLTKEILSQICTRCIVENIYRIPNCGEKKPKATESKKATQCFTSVSVYKASIHKIRVISKYTQTSLIWPSLRYKSFQNLITFWNILHTCHLIIFCSHKFKLISHFIETAVKRYECKSQERPVILITHKNGHSWRKLQHSSQSYRERITTIDL